MPANNKIAQLLTMTSLSLITLGILKIRHKKFMGTEFVDKNNDASVKMMDTEPVPHATLIEHDIQETPQMAARIEPAYTQSSASVPLEAISAVSPPGSNIPLTEPGDSNLKLLWQAIKYPFVKLWELIDRAIFSPIRWIREQANKVSHTVDSVNETVQQAKTTVAQVQDQLPTIRKAQVGSTALILTIVSSSIGSTLALWSLRGLMAQSASNDANFHANPRASMPKWGLPGFLPILPSYARTVASTMALENVRSIAMHMPRLGSTPKIC